VGSSAHQTAAVNHIGDAPLDGLQQFGIISGIILEVGVLDENDIAGDFTEAGAQGGPFPLIVLMIKRPYVIILLDQTLEDFPGPVSGGIVNDDKFLVIRGSLNPPDYFRQGGFLVIYGYYNTQFHVIPAL
jgi:hypothetical protein